MTGKEQQELSFDKEQNHGKEQQELTSDKGQDLSKMTGKEEEELTFDKEQYSSFGNYSVFLKHVKQSIKQTPKDGCSIQELLFHLQTSDPLDVYIFKLAALGEADPRISRHLEEAAPSVLASAHALIKEYLDPGHLGQGRPAHALDPLALTRAVKLVAWLGGGAGGGVVGLVEDVGKLALLPDTLEETSLLTGAATVSLLQAGSGSDEETIARIQERLEGLAGEPWGQLCLLQGVVSSAPSTLLLGQGKGQGDSLLILQLFPTLSQLCSSPSHFSFHSFSLLKLWASRLSAACFQVSADTGHSFPVPVPLSLVTSVLALTAANFENSHKGIPEACLVTYRTMLSLTSAVCKEDVRSSLLSSLLTSTLSLPWSVKAKYPSLSALLPEVGVAAVLEQDPSLPSQLATSLASVHLVRAGTEVFRLLCSSLAPCQWRASLGPVLLHSLLEAAPTVGQKCTEHWLPHMIKLQASSVFWLQDQLSSCSSSPGLLARLSLLALCRGSGQELEQGQGTLTLLQQCAVHPDTEIRAAAVSAICQARKRGTVPEGEELELVLSVLKDSATVHCTRFRLRLASSFSVLLCRCRDFSAQCVRTVAAGGDEGRLEEILSFLDTSLTVLFLHLLPGGNYQRRSFALDLLQVYVNNFVSFSRKGANKFSGNGDPSAVLARAAVKNQLQFVTEDNFRLLLLLLEDHMTDVVLKAAQLLRCFKPDVEEQESVCSSMVSLIHSGREGSCHSGAVMAALLHTWGATLRIDTQTEESSASAAAAQNKTEKMKPEITDHSEQITAPAPPTEMAPQPNTVVEPSAAGDIKVPPVCETGTPQSCEAEVSSESSSLPDQLLQLARETLGRCSTDFLSCSRSSPLHGVLAAIRHCLLKPSDTQVECLVQLVEDTVKTMLRVLSGRLAEEEDLGDNPDFLQMAQAIDRMIAEEGEEGEVEEEVGITESHTRVLSMAWHCLKESSLLCSHLGEVASPTADQVARCSQLFLSIATTCRHKGAMEAAHLACGQFSARLLGRGATLEQRAAPLAMLHTALTQLTSDWARSSFTRRSAGLPGLVCRLVAAEGGGRPRQLLPLALRTLLQCCGEKGGGEGEETEDSTASHALHVLRGLVQDATIAKDLTPHLLEVTQACLDSFDHQSWSVRNAGLQLFGALAPRVVGQVKVREEGEGFNRVEVAQVMARLPGLLELLLDRLEQGEGKGGEEEQGQSLVVKEVVGQRALLVDPAVVPILTILARLEAHSPCSLATRIVRVVARLEDCRVAKVRELVAQVLALHCTSTAEELLEMWKKEGQASKARGECVNTNQSHCRMMQLRHLVARGQYTSAAGLARKLAGLEGRCWVVKGEVARIQGILKPLLVVELQQEVDQELNPEVEKQETTGSSFEPGFAQWRELTGGGVREQGVLEGVEGWEEALQQLEARPCPSSALSLLGSLLESPQCRGRLLTRLLAVLLGEVREGGRVEEAQFPLMPQPELMLEVVDVTEHPSLEHHGSAVQCLVMQLRAAALSAMMLQDDWIWFFGEQSQYLSAVVQNSESVMDHSSPSQLEDSRLGAGASLLSYLPVLCKREVGGMALVLQYGLVNLVNSALLLLQDEEPEVRCQVARFCCQLPRPSPLSPTWPLLSQQPATEALLAWALRHLHQVSSMLVPVALLLSPLSLCLDSLARPDQKLGLFKRGDGVNVYQENSYSLALYYRCIGRHLEEGGKVDSNFQVSTLLKQGVELVSLLKEQPRIFPHSRTGDKFCSVASYFLQLSLLLSHPSLAKPALQGEQEKEARKLMEDLGEVTLAARLARVS